MSSLDMPPDIPVYLQRCASYGAVALKDFFDASIARLPAFSPRAAKVLIKPNLISAGIGLACSNALLLVALAEWLVDHGAHVRVGDSPAFGSASSVLRALGVDGPLRQRGVAIDDFGTVVRRRLACGAEIGVARAPLDCDLLLNVPKLKAHNQMYVTLAVKNLFGIVAGLRKSMLHMRHGGDDGLFCTIIVDLLDLLPPHIAVLDGIVGMHRQGPLHGCPLQFDCLAGAADPVALDTAMLQALRLDAEASPLWREARKRNCPGATMANIAFPLLRPQAFYGTTFCPPAEASPIRFDPLRFVWNNVRRTGMKLKEMLSA